MRSSRRGSALVMSLLMLAVLSIMAAAVFVVMRSQMRESIYTLRSAQAEAIAESGMEDALYQLRLSTSWRTGFDNEPFGAGRFSVSVSSDEAPWLTATGYSAPIAFFGPAVETVHAQARIAVSSTGVQVDWEPGTWGTGRPGP